MRMFMLWLIAIVISVAFLIFILLFGAGSKKDTILGRIYHILTDQIPDYLERFFISIGKMLRFLLGERISNFCCNSCGFIMNERHPIVQIFYLTLITGGLLIFLFEIAPTMPNKYITDIHWYFVLIRFPIGVIVLSTYGCFLAASFSDPGRLDFGSASRAAEIWPLDHILYDRKQCRTCLIDRPARSKHCPICKMCIAKLDHHCVWINNCVGYNNHKWFILFLFTTSMYCFYGTYLALQTLRYYYEKDGMVHLVMSDALGKHSPAPFLTRWMFLSQLHPLVGALAIFAALAGGIVYLFLQYQLYLIMSGITTSESFKWDDLAHAVATRQITTVSPFVLKFNKEYKYGQTFQDYVPDRKKPIDFEKDQVPLNDIKEVRNIYHQGAFKNFYQVFFPKKL